MRTSTKIDLSKMARTHLFPKPRMVLMWARVTMLRIKGWNRKIRGWIDRGQGLNLVPSPEESILRSPMYQSPMQADSTTKTTRKTVEVLIITIITTRVTRVTRSEIEIGLTMRWSMTEAMIDRVTAMVEMDSIERITSREEGTLIGVRTMIQGRMGISFLTGVDMRQDTRITALMEVIIRAEITT
jgi:hypothetical protein